MEKNNRNSPADKNFRRHAAGSSQQPTSSASNSRNTPPRRTNAPAGKSSRSGAAARSKPPFFSRQVLGRRLLIIFLLSFFISTALNIYVFGMTSDFFSRMFWCLLVVFLLSSLTALGIIPGVNRLMEKWPK